MCDPPSTKAAAQPAKNSGPILMICPRFGGGAVACLNASKSAPAEGRSTFERAPLMQSRQTSRPLSSNSASAGVGRPQTAHSDSSGGGSLKPGVSSPVNVIAEIEPDVV